jgi:hypothetical protein
MTCGTLWHCGSGFILERGSGRTRYWIVDGPEDDQDLGFFGAATFDIRFLCTNSQTQTQDLVLSYQRFVSERLIAWLPPQNLHIAISLLMPKRTNSRFDVFFQRICPE